MSSRDLSDRLLLSGRRGGKVISASDFQPEGRWFEPGRGLCRRVVSL